MRSISVAVLAVLTMALGACSNLQARSAEESTTPRPTNPRVVERDLSKAGMIVPNPERP